MMPAPDSVFEAALALPDDDRVELAAALLASLQPADRPPFPAAWREVIERRSREVASGQVQPVPWDEVKRQARERAGG